MQVDLVDLLECYTPLQVDGYFCLCIVQVQVCINNILQEGPISSPRHLN